MRKYTFTCKSNKTGKWDLFIVVLAENKTEAINILSNKYHSVTNYYSSNILIEDIKDIKTDTEEIEKCYNEIYKEKRLALATLIGGVGSYIAGNQITTKDIALNKCKNMKHLSINKLYESANKILK